MPKIFIPKYWFNYYLKYFIKSILEKSSTLYILLARFRYKGKRYETKIARKYFDLIIEGFPRSANSFSTRLFQHLEPRFLIGNHLHSYAHINYGIKNNIPTIVLIRNPIDAVISLAALDIISNYNESKYQFFKENSLKWMVNRYINFYQPLKKSLNKFNLLKFEEITKHPIETIKKINKSLNLDLVEDEEFIKFINNSIINRGKSHLKPSINRDKIKNELYNEINNDKDLKTLFEKANNIYLDIINN